MNDDSTIRELIRYETAVDGSAIRMHLQDSAGRLYALTFSTECINTLVMTLPGMALTAVQAKYNDPGLRVTYPLERFEVLFGREPGARFLTLETPDGFTVSFALTESQCRDIADAAGHPLHARTQH